MKAWMIAAIASAGLLAAAAPSLAQDHETGTPLQPQEAAGGWTLESAGRSICRVTLGQEKAGPGYAAKADAACGSALPGQPAAWQPTADGMRLVDAGGQPLISFGRWSNSLFVSRQSSGVDLQLRRGGSGGHGS